MKNKLLLILSTLSVANAFALEVKTDGPIKLEVKGGLDFQYIVYKDHPEKDSLGIARSGRDDMFYTSGHAELRAFNKLSDSMEYGVQVALEVTSRNARKAASSIFFISEVGKMEFGSNKSAYGDMSIAGNSMLVATKGAWDAFATLAPDQPTLFISSTANYLDAKTRLSDHVEYSRKLSYYTPWIGDHIMLGVSYIPDSQNAGITSIKDFIPHTPGVTGIPVQISKAWAGALALKFDNEVFKFKTVLAIETGKVAVKNEKGENDKHTQTKKQKKTNQF